MKLLPKFRAIVSKQILVRTLFAIWIILTVYLVYSYWQSSSKSNLEKDANALKQKLSNHVVFEGLEPAFATVTDAEVLIKSDPFYKRAQNGDRVIIWEEKALLYRPSIDRIVDFGIVIRQPVNQQQNLSKQAKARVLILNGTRKIGAARQLKEQIDDNSSLATLIESITVKDAIKKDYNETVISDLSKGKFPSLLDELIENTNGQIEQLPESESVVDDVDVVIIVGEQP